MFLLDADPNAALSLPMYQWAVNAIGVMGTGVLVLTFVKLCKSVFGSKPPLDDQLKQMVKLLRGEIHREKNSALKEFKLKLSPLVDRVRKNEEDIGDMKITNERRHQENTDNLHALELAMAKLTGRIEAVLNKLESK